MFHRKSFGSWLQILGNTGKTEAGARVQKKASGETPLALILVSPEGNYFN
jgi:hypothetical protein